MRVLRLLDLEGPFAAVISLEDMAYIPKPDRNAYQTAMARLGAQAESSALIDDTRTNLGPAKRIGMRTFWVSEVANADPPDDAIDHVIANLHEIEAILAR